MFRTTVLNPFSHLFFSSWLVQVISPSSFAALRVTFALYLGVNRQLQPVFSLIV